MGQFFSEKEWDTFLRLLRAGLWEQAVILPYVPDEAGAERLLEMGRRQAVVGLLLRSVIHLPKTQLPSAAIRMKLLAESDVIERQNLLIQLIEGETRSFFESYGLHPIVQKGSQAARHYAQPLLRQSGDIDFYLKGDEFQRACALIPDGTHSSDGSFVFRRKGVVVELHPRYFDLHLPDKQLPGVPSVCAELLLYSAHILKHALGAGVGIKQLCDMARALSELEGSYDKTEMENAVRKAGLLRWHRMLCSLLVERLGLESKYCLPDFRPCRYRSLERIIRKGGNFGLSSPLRTRGLRARNPRVRKFVTALSFVKRIPFSLRYAPREAWATFRELIHGNLYA